jgi:release factor glutamine methyltransferase
MSNSSINDLVSLFRLELGEYYDYQELNNILFLLMEEHLGLTRMAIHLDPDLQVDDAGSVLIKEAIIQLKEYVPIQYILGKAHFYGLQFMVNKHVLIPRPETEELVDWLVHDIREGNKVQNVIDLGTGSGCIAIAVKKTLPHLSVIATDISHEALKVARANAARNDVTVSFHWFDMLKPEGYETDRSFGAIISNPPYVRKSERLEMKPNVLDYEPGKALFVEDEHPLVFYRAIAEFAHEHLGTGGSIYIEFNEKMGAAVESLFKSLGYQSVQIKKDIHGRDRMARIRRAV